MRGRERYRVQTNSEKDTGEKEERKITKVSGKELETNSIVTIRFDYSLLLCSQSRCRSIRSWGMYTTLLHSTDCER